MNSNFIKSDRGNLCEINFSNVPFHVNRIFFVDNVKVGEVRGDHAHHKEKQFIICTNGSIKVEWISSKGIYSSDILNIGDEFYSIPMTWLKLTFLVENSSFACLCSNYYNEEDYIRDFSKFQELINAKL